MLVNFRYGDTDLAAYLMTLGYEYDKVEVERDRDRKLRAYIHFYGDKDNLIRSQNEYRDGTAIGNISKFAANRKKIVKTIKSELLRYQAKNI